MEFSFQTYLRVLVFLWINVESRSTNSINHSSRWVSIYLSLCPYACTKTKNVRGRWIIYVWIAWSYDLVIQYPISLETAPLLLVIQKKSRSTCSQTRIGFDSLQSRYFSQNNARYSVPFSKDYRSHPMTCRLWRLHRILQDLASSYALHWIGLFRLMQGVNSTEWGLVKESYIGDMSRPVIPLNLDWVERNNCAWSSMYGKIRYSPDLRKYVHDYSWLKCRISNKQHLQIWVKSVFPYSMFSILPLLNCRKQEHSQLVFLIVILKTWMPLTQVLFVLYVMYPINVKSILDMLWAEFNRNALLSNLVEIWQV